MHKNKIDDISKIVARQEAYYAIDAKQWKEYAWSETFPNIDELLSLNLPKYKHYSVCNLRGGIGKSRI